MCTFWNYFSWRPQIVLLEKKLLPLSHFFLICTKRYAQMSDIKEYTETETLWLFSLIIDRILRLPQHSHSAHFIPQLILIFRSGMHRDLTISHHHASTFCMSSVSPHKILADKKCKTIKRKRTQKNNSNRVRYNKKKIVIANFNCSFNFAIKWLWIFFFFLFCFSVIR